MTLSPPDRVFIPLAILAAAGLIWLALAYRPLGQDPVVTDTRFLMEGSALAQLIPGPGTEIVFDPAAPGGPVARAAATATIEAAGSLSAGVGAVIPPEFEARLPGRAIEVEIALSNADPELTEVGIGYFTVGSGDTGWRRVDVEAEGSILTLRHDIPLDAPLGNNDWVGIWPDLEGAGRTVAIRRIEVRLLPEAGEP
jgi:hypothetical protein